MNIEINELAAKLRAETLEGMFLRVIGNTIEVFGRYFKLGDINISGEGYVFELTNRCGGYTPKKYSSLVRCLAEELAKKPNLISGRAMRKITARKNYDTHFPYLSLEVPFEAFEVSGIAWAIFENIGPAHLAGIYHLDNEAYRRYLAAIIGVSPLPIPIRDAIIEG